jgi:hypothetical protein
MPLFPFLHLAGNTSGSGAAPQQGPQGQTGGTHE